MTTSQQTSLIDTGGESSTTLPAANTAAVANPMQLLAEAVRNNADVETAKGMMELYERWERNQARMAFAAAMQAAQSDMPTVVYDRRNQHTNSDYASLENVQSTIKRVCNRHGFTVSLGEADSPREHWIRVKMVVRHVGGHEEFYFRDGPIDNLGPKGNPTKSELHGAQSTVSYLQRQMLLDIFGVVVARQDMDGNPPQQFITPEQVIQLNEMIDAYKVNRPAFLTWIGAASVEEIPAGKFPVVFDMLKRKGGGK